MQQYFAAFYLVQKKTNGTNGKLYMKMNNEILPP